jgi:plasmid stabilization system protein ParE
VSDVDITVSVSDEAWDDARAAADWYIDQDAWPAAQALFEEIDHALERLRRSPGLGTPSRRGTRTLPIHRFHISLIYRWSDSTVRVIAVAPQRRRLGCWVGRV